MAAVRSSCGGRFCKGCKLLEFLLELEFEFELDMLFDPMEKVAVWVGMFMPCGRWWVCECPCPWGGPAWWVVTITRFFLWVTSIFTGDEDVCIRPPDVRMGVEVVDTVMPDP